MEGQGPELRLKLFLGLADNVLQIPGMSDVPGFLGGENYNRVGIGGKD
jgi:hypothetical protein